MNKKRFWIIAGSVITAAFVLFGSITAIQHVGLISDLEKEVVVLRSQSAQAGETNKRFDSINTKIETANERIDVLHTATVNLSTEVQGMSRTVQSNVLAAEVNSLKSTVSDLSISLKSQETKITAIEFVTNDVCNRIDSIECVVTSQELGIPADCGIRYPQEVVASSKASYVLGSFAALGAIIAIMAFLQ